MFLWISRSVGSSMYRIVFVLGLSSKTFFSKSCSFLLILFIYSFSPLVSELTRCSSVSPQAPLI